MSDTETLAAPLARREDYAALEAALLVIHEEDFESWKEMMRRQSEADLFFLMRNVLSTGAVENAFPDGLRFIDHPFSFDMARLAQFDVADALVVWMMMAARGHGKSITYTFALIIWLYIKHPTWCFCIWSVTRNLAKSKLRALRNEIEKNKLLPLLWPDRFYHGKPRTEASCWSLDDGLAMPLLSPARDCVTFEAWGLVDQAFPTGKHFDAMSFDDVVDERCISTPEMILAARQTHDMAGGVEMPSGCKRWYVGTPYADGDTAVQLIKEGIVRLRARSGVDPTRQDTAIRRQLGGAPVFLTEEMMLKKQKEMGANYWSQMCLDPFKGKKGTLDITQLRFYDRDPHEERMGKTCYLLVDPNGGFVPTVNDPMALVVVALGGDKNFYLLDAVVGHFNPAERQRLIVAKRAEWEPLEVRVEEMTIQADSFWLQNEMERTGHRFEVQSIRVETMRKGSGPRGNWTRVQRLTEAFNPLLSENRLYLPRRLVQPEKDGGTTNLIEEFTEQLRRFPIAERDDLLSAFALLFADHGGKRGARPLVWPSAHSGMDRFYPESQYPYLYNRQPSERSWLGVG